MLLVSESTKQLPRGSSTWLRLEVVTGIPVGTGRVAFIWDPSCIVLHGMFDSISIDLCFHCLLCFPHLSSLSIDSPVPSLLSIRGQSAAMPYVLLKTHPPQLPQVLYASPLGSLNPFRCMQPGQTTNTRAPSRTLNPVCHDKDATGLWPCRQTAKNFRKDKKKKNKERMRTSATHGEREPIQALHGPLLLLYLLFYLWLFYFPYKIYFLLLSSLLPFLPSYLNHSSKCFLPLIIPVTSPSLSFLSSTCVAEWPFPVQFLFLLFHECIYHVHRVVCAVEFVILPINLPFCVSIISLHQTFTASGCSFLS